MGDVVVMAKVVLEDASKAEEVLTKIKEKLNVSDSKLEELGFGIKVLKIAVMVDDAEGSPDVEAVLSQLEGVSSVEIEGVTRV